MSQRIRSLAKHSAVYGFSNGLNKLLPLIALPVLSRYLTPEDYGIIALLGLIAYAYNSLFGLGLGVSTGILYFKTQSGRQRESTIWTSFGILAVSASVLVAIASAFGESLSLAIFRQGRFASLVLLHAVGIGLLLMAQPLLWRLQFESRAVLLSSFLFLNSAVTITASLGLIVWLGRGVQGWVEAVIVGNSVLLVALLVFRTAGRFSFDSFALASELIRQGAPHIPAFAFVFVIQYSGLYMLEWLVPLDQVGIYGIGHNMGMALALATAAFSSAWYPFFQGYGERQTEARPVFQRILVGYAFTFGVLSLCFFLFAEPVVSLLLDKRYHDAVWVIGPVAVAQMCLGMWVILLPGVYFAGETHYMPIVQGIIAALVLGMNVLLIPVMGIVGAAVSLALGAAGLVVNQMVLNNFRQYPAVSYEWVRPALLLCLLMLTGGMMSLAGRLFPPVTSFLIGVAMIGLYVLVGWGLLASDDRASFWQWIREKAYA